MTTRSEHRPFSAAAARVLALMVAANGRADPRELQALEDVDAFARLDVPREHFVALVNECLQVVGYGLAECSWLRASDQAYVDRLLDAVVDPQERLMVCRMAAAVVTADGHVSGDERLVYDHALARWRISGSMVTEAILHDAPRRREGVQRLV
ncbi:TerB family tellurite resistance protein [Variovorax sp. YR752]|uniref:TerB family tellurite resistance protein n=1 Tax=Variovorax sp. YR752 TaxID=1884383 RepID=UPI00313820A8